MRDDVFKSILRPRVREVLPKPIVDASDVRLARALVENHRAWRGRLARAGKGEGNVIYNFETGEIWVCDFEFYERGDSYILQMDKTYGSTRLRPPEEYCKGERIDQLANVFTLGRYAVCALSEQIDERWPDGFQGSGEQADVIERATQQDRDQRYGTVR